MELLDDFCLNYKCVVGHRMVVLVELVVCLIKIKMRISVQLTMEWMNVKALFFEF